MKKTIVLATALLATAALAGCVEEAEYTEGPRLGTNEREYVDDGCAAGTSDAQMGMSMAYERHEGYDSRFEPYFRQGYEECWAANR